MVILDDDRLRLHFSTVSLAACYDLPVLNRMVLAAPNLEPDIIPGVLPVDEDRSHRAHAPLATPCRENTLPVEKIDDGAEACGRLIVLPEHA